GPGRRAARHRPRSPDRDQSAGREGRRRGRRHRVHALPHERGDGCIAPGRRQALRHAGDFPARLGGVARGARRQAGSDGDRRMKRASLYSSSRAKAVAVAPVPVLKKAALSTRFKESFRRNRVALLAATPGLVALGFVLYQWNSVMAPQQLTQEHIDAAVVSALETVPLPSVAAKAYEAVRGSIVRVRAYVEGPDGEELESG